MVPRLGLNSQPVHLEHVACSGTELSLLDCSYTSDTGQNDHSKDVGVRCLQGKLMFNNIDCKDTCQAIYACLGGLTLDCINTVSLNVDLLSSLLLMVHKHTASLVAMLHVV